MSNPFENLAKMVEKASKEIEQVLANPGWKSTVIIHPQISKSADEATALAADWKKREEKQLIDNVMRILG